MAVTDRFAKGWPTRGADAGAAAYVGFGGACQSPASWDAHFSSYSAPAHPHRLDGSALALLADRGEAISMQLFVIDVDGPGHVATPEWLAAERPKIDALLAAHAGAYVYTTRGGYRICYALPRGLRAFRLLDVSRREQWSASYKAWLDYLSDTFRIVGDPSCKDWTRLYRLPRVRRDGVDVVPELELGDPNELGVWDRPFAPVPAPKPAALHGELDPGDGSPAVIAAARARLKLHGPAISGSGGDGHTRAAWGILINDFALDEELARGLLLEWNETCEPPWDEAELFWGPARSENQKWNGEYGKARRAVEFAEGLTARASDASATLPTIVVRRTEITRVVDEAEQALAELGTVYVRNRALVRVVRDAGSADWIRRPEGMPVVTAISKATLRELLGRAARWVAESEDDEGNVVEHEVMVPAWVVETLLERGEWRQLPPLEGVIESPVLRADGTVLTERGYDRGTRLIYAPVATYPAIPSEPSHAEARAAVAALLDPFRDFPWVAPHDRALFAAYVLTLVARPAIDGPVPAFVFDAPTPGTGKTLLAELGTVIATGRKLARMSQTDSDEETRKRITSLVLECPPVVLIDNVVGAIGSPALDAALTADEWQDRGLGRNVTVRASIRFVWTISGNNVSTRGDLARRVEVCRLDARVEHPEYRTGFHHPNLPDHVAAHRPALLAAALTVLRGYFAAGRPPHGKTPKASYESWDRIVRGACMWALDVDPCAGEARIHEQSDDGRDDARRVLHAWRETFKERPATVGEAMMLRPGNDLRNALVAFAGKEDPRLVGYAVRRLRDRIVDGTKLEDAGLDPATKVRTWRVISV
ncbi:MAG TPA: hypothetical protein VGG74_14820 [Kofleriaceae bacterium]